MAKRARNEKRLAREYADAVKNIETAHAAELAALAAKHAAEIERWQDQTSNLLSEKAAAERKVTVVEKERDTARAQVSRLTEEGNQLRGIIRHNENELARRAGYMTAINDARPKPPPVMVPRPEPDEDDFADSFRAHDGFLETPVSGDRYAKNRKGWWEQ